MTTSLSSDKVSDPAGPAKTEAATSHPSPDLRTGTNPLVNRGRKGAVLLLQDPRLTQSY